MWGGFAGIFVIIGFASLLRAFTMGRMGIIAPVSAVLAAAVPVVFTAIVQGFPRELQLLGFGLALISIWMFSRPESFRGRPEGLGMAFLAGLGFGIFFIALDQIGNNAVFWPLVASQTAGIALVLAWALVTQRKLFPSHVPVVLLILNGVLGCRVHSYFCLQRKVGG